MLKAHKIRIYPTGKQAKVLAQWFGQSRHSYNFYLNLKKDKIPDKEISKLFTAQRNELEWLKDVPRTVQSCAMQNGQDAFDRFFKKQNKFPKFKNKSAKKSAAFQMDLRSTGKNSSWNNNEIMLPGLGRVKHRDAKKLQAITGNPVLAVSQQGDKYFLSYHHEFIPIELTKTGNSIGIDLGLYDFIVDSNGRHIAAPKFLRKKEANLKRYQRRLSRQVKGSNRRKKTQVKIAHLHLRIVDMMKDFEHKLSTEIVRNNDIICLEDLFVAGMIRNRKLSKSIADASWSAFVTMLVYKAKWAGRTVIFVNRFFPSSKKCSCCGEINHTLTLADREWQCGGCRAWHVRDGTAAVNIDVEGMRKYRDGLSRINAQGDEDSGANRDELLVAEHLRTVKIGKLMEEKTGV